jgi:hypothetical protein
MSERDARLAKNEAVFREVNERIRDLTTFGEQVEFLCECGDPGCLEPIPMSVPEYERVRGEPMWFLIVPGHVIPTAEAVVEEHERFHIVQKRDGVPAAIAIDTDPRD